MIYNRGWQTLGHGLVLVHKVFYYRAMQNQGCIAPKIKKYFDKLALALFGSFCEIPQMVYG